LCHIARPVCRRAERLTISVNEDDGHADMVVKYLNRLSDYFFILSRKLSVELKSEEITWIPRS
jgi:cob(I)alamin adenosyltransferase